MNKNYNHTLIEEKIQKFWQDNNIYKFKNSNKPIFSIDTPPPTVSGSLHIGHIFSYTQTDIIARYKRMSGFEVFYPMGFDDNGLPTEKFVEKKRDIKAYQLGRSEFIKICLEETQKVELNFEKLWKHIALSVDWNLLYSTIDDNTRKISQASFIKLYNKNYIYRKNEPAIFCTNCNTSVAQAELEDLEKDSYFYTIKFMLQNSNNYINIATTRPELLASCVAIFYNPEDERYKNLENLKAIVPIYNFEVPILKDPLVEIEKGTGLVMCCTFGDKTDITWYKKYNFEYKQSILLDGKWSSITGPLEGMRVASARETIIKLLSEKNYIISYKKIKHYTNVHERCKKEVEYLILNQWFLKILDFKEKFISLADSINWYPAFMKSRYINWVENISWDWCISRQRFFGIPFPVWHCINCKNIILADISELPIDPWEDTKNRQCSKCGSYNIEPDKDVMDTWNTSSLTPYLALNIYISQYKQKNSTILLDDIFNNSNKFLPMTIRPQAHDIIRTWAFYTIVKSWMHSNEIPWNNIVISGHVLSPLKEKISKSKGNSPLEPHNLLENFPADAIRYWTASSSLGYDSPFCENQIKIGNKLIIKLHNAFLLISNYKEDISYNFYDILKKLNHSTNFGIVNRWILTKFYSIYNLYKKYLDNNDFLQALHTIEKFFWSIFCDNYLEIVKDILNNPNNYNYDYYISTKLTLYTIGFNILQLYSPFVPYITEDIYLSLYKDNINIDSIHKSQYKDYIIEFNDNLSLNIIEKILIILSLVRKLKSEKQISLKESINNINIYLNNIQDIEHIKNEELLFKKTLNIEKVNYFDNKIYNKTENKLENINKLYFAEIIV